MIPPCIHVVVATYLLHDVHLTRDWPGVRAGPNKFQVAATQIYGDALQRLPRRPYQHPGSPGDTGWPTAVWKRCHRNATGQRQGACLRMNMLRFLWSSEQQKGYPSRLGFALTCAVFNVDGVVVVRNTHRSKAVSFQMQMLHAFFLPSR